MWSSLYSLISAWADRTPDAPAILGVARSPLSFQRLAEQIRNTVQALHRLGIGCGDRVAIVIPNGPEAAVCCYAVACGATSVPLNPAYTRAEFETFFSHLAPRALIACSDPDSPAILAARSTKVPVILLVPEPDAGAFHLENHEVCERPFKAPSAHHVPAQSNSSQGVPAQAQDVAFLLQTSGSTSQPKMVPLTHTNVCSSALSLGTAFELTPNDCCLTIMPWFHINALVTTGLSTLAAGGSLACPPGFQASHFFAWMEEFHFTWYSAVPAMQQAIVERARQGEYKRRHSRLRFVRSSAAALSPQLRELTETLLGVPVIEGYGLTEANCSALNPLPPGIRKAGSVGRTVCGEIAVMDDQGVLLPAGTTGEIVLRGPHVMSGYENDPAASRSSFWGNWFRTGDLGRFDRDGYLFLTGRIKEIINRGGEKIGPREVDEALLAHPAVAEAVAFAIPDPALGEDVAAAVVLREGAQVSAGELREFAALRLAEFKIPRRIVFLPELPKGPTGKVQRIGLAAELALTANESAAGAGGVGSGWTERLLTQIWEDVLKRPLIGRNDDFASLGGHSLLGASILARVESCFGATLSLANLLQATTVAQMAALIGEDAKPVPSRVIPIRSGAGGVPIYLLHVSRVFAPLMQALPRTQPVMAVSVFDPNLLPETFALEDIARRQIQAIQEFQPEGPYVLAGWCADGVLAYEMAQQLLRQGHNVPLLVFMDAFNPARSPQSGGWARWQYRIRERLDRERFHLKNLAARGPREALVYLRERSRNALGIMKKRTRSLQRNLGWFPKTRDAGWFLVDALHRYTPSPYQGAAMYFRAQHRPSGENGDPAEAWRGLVKDMVVCDIPGDHIEMFGEPNVRVMARNLATRMEMIEARHPILHERAPLSR